MNYRKQESLLPPDLLQVLLKPVADAGSAFARLDERIARSPVGGGFLERTQYADACASLRSARLRSRSFTFRRRLMGAWARAAQSVRSHR